MSMYTRIYQNIATCFKMVEIKKCHNNSSKILDLMSHEIFTVVKVAICYSKVHLFGVCLFFVCFFAFTLITNN